MDPTPFCKSSTDPEGHEVAPTPSNTLLSCDNSKVWIISKGRLVDGDIGAIAVRELAGPVKEYRVSDLGRYLLNPNAIEVKKKLIGCEIHYKRGVFRKIGMKLKKCVPDALKRRQSRPLRSPDVIVSRFKWRLPALKDPGLEAHLNHIYEQLRSYDTVAKRLSQLDPRKICQIVGICEDVGGNFSYLKLQGSIEEKIKYLGNFIAKDVGVILSKAHIADGLFELRGFDFDAYDAARSHRLVCYHADGGPRACVLTADAQLDFQVSDYDLIKQMHLLEQSLKANSGLRDAFGLCVAGQAKPLKLFFNKKLEIDYSKSHFPPIYRDLFTSLNLGLNQRNMIKPILNYMQIGVSLNYILLADAGEDRMFTQIAVLHDFRALEPLRKNLPDLYSEMCKRVFDSEAGRYYLLDSINGFSNA